MIALETYVSGAGHDGRARGGGVSVGYVVADNWCGRRRRADQRRVRAGLGVILRRTLLVLRQLYLAWYRGRQGARAWVLGISYIRLMARAPKYERQQYHGS